MKLVDLYINKFCPDQPRYKCDGSNCVRFLYCMIKNIDALYTIGGITIEEADDLDRELAETVRRGV